MRILAQVLSWCLNFVLCLLALLTAVPLSPSETGAHRSHAMIVIGSGRKDDPCSIAVREDTLAELQEMGVDAWVEACRAKYDASNNLSTSGD